MHPSDDEEASEADVQDLGVFPGGTHAVERGAPSDRPTIENEDDEDDVVEDLGVFSWPCGRNAADSKISANEEPVDVPRGGVGLMLESSSMRVTLVLEGSLAHEVGFEPGALHGQVVCRTLVMCSIWSKSCLWQTREASAGDN